VVVWGEGVDLATIATEDVWKWVGRGEHEIDTSKKCYLNIESSHTFVIEYIHISLFHKYKFIFWVNHFSLDLSLLLIQVNMTLGGGGVACVVGRGGQRRR
jgi:hypothetical protein